MASSFLSSSVLDDAHLNRAAPVGSMRYFALLYTPEEKRELALALFVIDSEIRESARGPSHDVAHTRLQWWRQEIDRLVNDNAQHPATKILSASSFDRREYARLHELIVAADMDLARMTYLNDQELRAYCTRSGGAIAELMAMLLAHPEALDDATRKAANRLGALVRAAEIVRDARQDVYDGRLYVPLDSMEQHGATENALRSQHTLPEGRAALQTLAASVREEIDATLASISRPMRAYLRPHYVLAGLHDALLAEIARRDFDVGPERIELGPIRKPWAAWRAARRAN
jgi:phytoene synthase